MVCASHSAACDDVFVMIWMAKTGRVVASRYLHPILCLFAENNEGDPPAEIKSEPEQPARSRRAYKTETELALLYRDITRDHHVQASPPEECQNWWSAHTHAHTERTRDASSPFEHTFGSSRTQGQEKPTCQRVNTLFTLPVPGEAKKTTPNETRTKLLPAGGGLYAVVGQLTIWERSYFVYPYLHTEMFTLYILRSMY